MFVSLDVILIHNLQTVFDRNITHNLIPMAKRAKLYVYVWRPSVVGIRRAHQLIEPLQFGLAMLKTHPEKYKKYDDPEGWGTHDQLIDFTENYLNACISWPDATVEAFG